MQHLEAKDGTQIAYELKGTGQVVLLLGGMFAPSDVFHELSPFLHRNGFSTLKIGYRGLGDTHAYERFELEDILDDIIQVLEAQQIKKFHILGEALGSTLAMSLALKLPQQVKRMVLGCPATIRDARFALKLQSWMSILNATDLDTLVLSVMSDFAAQSFLDGHFEHLPLIAERLLENKQKHQVLWLFQAAQQYKNNIEYDKIKQPCLVVHGNEDNILHRGHSVHLVEQLPEGELVDLPCGHILSEELPDQFAHAAINFLSHR